MQQFRPIHFARLKHLAVFAIVVDAGSFTKAGKRLGLAKSAVSRYVSELEEEVGVALLTRTTRKLVLTEPGERFYVDCARFVEAATDSFDAVEPDAHLLGSLHVGATHAFGRHVVLPAINTFLGLHPDLSVQMSLNDRHVDLVTQGIDLTFRIGTPGTAPSYVSRRIATTRFELFASRKFVETHDLSSLRSLESLPWVLSPLGPNPETWVFRKRGKTETIHTKSRLLTDSAEVAVHAGELGMGVVGIPDFMRSACDGLVPVFTDYVVEPELAVYAVYPRRRFVSPRVRGFLAHLEPLLVWTKQEA
ncbi:MAG: LysR family transcriptional regulator [Nannocystales bacterium]